MCYHVIYILSFCVFVYTLCTYRNALWYLALDIVVVVLAIGENEVAANHEFRNRSNEHN